jgi:hypothetical protein
MLISQLKHYNLCAAFLCALFLLGACASSGTKEPTAPVQAPAKPPASAPGPSTPPPAAPATRQIPNSNASAVVDLEKILGDELSVWKKQYTQRRRLGANCPTTTSFNYGMRLLQPSSFRGDYADIVRQRYGDGSEFLVLAVADAGAAARAGVLPGDRISRIHTVKADQVESAKRVATESRSWHIAYTLDLERDGKRRTIRLSPDRLCDIKL